MMYHAHFSSAMTVRERSSFPCWGDFCYYSRNCALPEPACACNRGSVCYPSCSPRQSALIHHPAGRRAGFLGGCVCRRSRRNGFPSFRLGGQCLINKIPFGAHRGIDYGVEFHNWVQEMLSLLGKFGRDKVPFQWNVTGFHSDPSLLCHDHEHGSEEEFRFLFERWNFGENSNRKEEVKIETECKCQWLNVVGGRTRNRGWSCPYLCEEDERENAEEDNSLSGTEHTFNSKVKRQQFKRKGRREYLGIHERFTEDSCASHRHDHNESVNASLRANTCYRERQEASYEGKNCRRNSSMDTARSNRQQISCTGGQYLTENEERSNRQRNEMKVCAEDQENFKPSARKCNCRCHEEQARLKVAGSKVNSTNVTNEMQEKENLREYFATESHQLNSSSDARYRHRNEQSVFVSGREETVSYMGDSSQNATAIQGNTVDQVTRKPISPHSDAAIRIWDSGMSRYDESQNYVSKRHHSPNTAQLERLNNHIVAPGAKISQEQLSSPSSSHSPVASSSRTSHVHQASGYATSDYTEKNKQSSDVKYMQELRRNRKETESKILEPVELLEKPTSSYPQLKGEGTLLIGGAHRSGVSSTVEYLSEDHHIKHLQESTSSFERISELSGPHEEVKPQYSQYTLGGLTVIGGAHQSGESSISEYISRLPFSENLQEPNTSYEWPTIIMSEQINSQDIPVHPPPFTTAGSKNGSIEPTSIEYVDKDNHFSEVRNLHELNNNAQIGTTILKQTALQESSTHLPYIEAVQGSPTGVHQGTGYTRNEGLMESSQLGYDTLNVHIQGEASASISEPTIRSDSLRNHAYPIIGDVNLSSTVLLEKSPDEPGEPSLGKLQRTDLPPQRIIERSEKMYLIEREKSSETTSILQQIVMGSPHPQSNTYFIQDVPGENTSKDFGVQGSRKSPASSETTGPSEEMWHVAHETFEEHSSVETPESSTAIATMSSGENLTKTTTNEEGNRRISSRNPVVKTKRSNRSLWNYLAEIIKSGWVFQAKSPNSAGQSSAKISLTESVSTESGSSDHEPEGIGKTNEKRDVLKRARAIRDPVDEDTGSNLMDQRQETSGVLKKSPVMKGSIDDHIFSSDISQTYEPVEGVSFQATVVNSEVGTTSSIGLHDRAKSLPTEYSKSQVPFSGHEADHVQKGKETTRLLKKSPAIRRSFDEHTSSSNVNKSTEVTGMLTRSPAIRSLVNEWHPFNVNQRQEFTDSTNILSLMGRSEVVTSSMGLSDHGLIQKKGPIGSLPTPSVGTSPDTSTCTSDVQEHISTAELEFTSRMNVQSRMLGTEVAATSFMGVSDHNLFQRKAPKGSLPAPSGSTSPDIVISAGISDEQQHRETSEVNFSDRMNIKSTVVVSEIDTIPSTGLSGHGSIRRRAPTGSLATSSGRALPGIVISKGAGDVQEHIETSEVGASSLEIERIGNSKRYHYPSSTMGRETGDAGNEDMQRAVEETKLKRASQVQRERFEEWEEACRIESEQRKLDEMFMKEALVEARKAADTWEVPVGAVLVQDGKIISRGYNLVEELRDSTAHAEMMCIRDASKLLRTWRLAGTTLYVTLEPCAMCAGAILQARIETLVWGAPNKLLGADGSWVRLFPSDEGHDQPTSPGPRHPFHPNMKIRRGILAAECSDAMQQFFQLRRKRAKTPDTPPSLPVATTTTKFFSKIHHLLSVMFCL